MASVYLFVYCAYFVPLPVSLHPLTIIEVKNTMTRKNDKEVTLVCSRVFLFFLRHVYTCSYLSSELPQRERTKKGGRRGAWRKEGRRAVKTKAKPVTPAFQSLFRGWWGVCSIVGRLVSMCFPSERWNLQIPSSVRPGFWRFTHAMKVAELLQCENNDRKKERTCEWMCKYKLISLWS